MMTQPHDIRTAPLDELETWARDQDPTTAALVERLTKAEQEAEDLRDQLAECQGGDA